MNKSKTNNHTISTSIINIVAGTLLFTGIYLGAIQLLSVPSAVADHGLTEAECKARFSGPANETERNECVADAQANPGGAPITPINNCPQGTVPVGVPINGQRCIENGEMVGNNAIINYLRIVLRFMSIGIGLVVALMIAVSGVQYITSAGNPDGVKKAKSRLTNAIVALILFIFAFALINYLVPGGVIG